MAQKTNGVFKHYSLDTHTEVLSENLTLEEKQEFGIDENLFAYFNEIGFSTPAGSEAWDEDCFNIITSEDRDFDNIEVILLPISKLPKRLKETYGEIVNNRVITHTIK